MKNLISIFSIISFLLLGGVFTSDVQAQFFSKEAREARKIREKIGVARKEKRSERKEARQEKRSERKEARQEKRSERKEARQDRRSARKEKRANNREKRKCPEKSAKRARQKIVNLG